MIDEINHVRTPNHNIAVNRLINKEKKTNIVSDVDNDLDNAIPKRVPNATIFVFIVFSLRVLFLRIKAYTVTKQAVASISDEIKIDNQGSILLIEIL